MNIEIKCRWTSKVLFSHECEGNTIKLTLERAVSAGADLYGANLVNARLVNANLDGANLYGACLVNANLDGACLVNANLINARLVNANLDGANLAGANLVNVRLVNANLDGANLYGADLYGANLDGACLVNANLINVRLVNANLDGANLYGADLYGANLDGACLVNANLAPIKSDFYEVLNAARAEIPYLRDALVNGRVDGSVYEGDCACLIGTIAKARSENFLKIGITPDASRPSERWFMGISRGDTPETNQISRIAVGWIDEFLSEVTA
jgi:uncharacterized protein YjbI with pentapeptide repeats